MPGDHFRIRKDLFLLDFAKSQNHEVEYWDGYIALKFGMRSSSAAEKTAKFHGDQKTLNNDLMPLILHMIFWQDIPARWAHGLPWWPWTAMNNVIYELVKYFCIFVLNVLNIKFTATTADDDTADTDTDTVPPTDTNTADTDTDTDTTNTNLLFYQWIVQVLHKK